MTDPTKPASISFANEDGGDTQTPARPRLVQVAPSQDGWSDPSQPGFEPDPFGELEDEDDFDSEAPQPKKKPAKGAKKGPSPLMLGMIGGLFFLFVAGMGGTIYMKRRAKAAEREEMMAMQAPPQPEIVAASGQPEPGPQAGNGQPAGQPIQDVSQAAPAGQVNQNMAPAQAGAPAPAAAAAAPVQVQPTTPAAAPAPAAAVEPPAARAPVVAPAPAPAVAAAPVATQRPADAVSNDAVMKEVASLKEAIGGILKRLDRMEAEARNKPAAAAAATQKVQATATEASAKATAATNKPSKADKAAEKAARAEEKARKAAEERRTTSKESAPEPVSLRDYWISGLVNNRAFVVRKAADGTEQELSVVVGDSIEGTGRKVIGIDPATKVITLEGGQRITTARQR